ncbi:exo-poly-alpha-D-galacturonosidase [Edaphobacter acidisoli]|uniref:Exo-poly-alpha-D-galacturonosidase n=1 Tax=Edaphobacter acidisoli TaxID=2040573 RepID=A0A916RT85_9BACT|nr:glycoside hydrolase family 28 protein [Edaphobacter acidisoli]GGA69304.1 exo-poly-alpha-D-galacturonosidase [Edaphobacter acidisoli]
MDAFNSARRELLKFGGMGLAVAATSMPSAYASTKSSARSSALQLFDVRTYGAVGDGKAVDSPAINKAIEAAAAAGGGTVFFPAGTWLSFSIRLKSNVDLYLSQGAVLLAADSPLPGQTTGYNGGTYDAAESNAPWEDYQDYGHNHWHNSLIWGENLHDIGISGPGLIYGKGLSFGAGPGRPPGAPPRPAGARPYVPHKRGDYVMFQAEQAGVGNKSIALKNCRNVILRDFSILKGGHFGLLLTGVDNMTIDNLKIDTDRDGMDIDCCKNVRVSNCMVNSPWDDGICPKSSYALGYARATENVTITNCYVTGTYELGTVLDGTWKKFPPDVHSGYTGRIKCGTESNGGFKNITISNCVFDGCHGLALESEDGALCEDIAITNITQRDVHESPIFFRLGARLRGPKDTTKVGTLQRIVVDNFVSYNNESRVCSILSGIPGYEIKDIKMSNIYIQHQGGDYASQVGIVPPENVDKYPDPGMFGPMPAQGFFFRHVRNLEMSHVEVAPMNPDPRPAFALQDVNRADFIAVTAPTNPAAFSLNKVTDLRVLLSRAAKDTVLESADGKTI